MYDNKLLEIDFYKNSRIHKLMLPYIGSKYEKYKVLIVAESHYLIEDSDREKVKDFNKWIADKNEIKLMNEEYINTREVVKKHCSNNNKQPFFSNIKKEIINIEKFWDKISFMNFFIVPSINGSRTIAVSKDKSLKHLIILINVPKSRNKINDHIGISKIPTFSYFFKSLLFFSLLIFSIISSLIDFSPSKSLEKIIFHEVSDSFKICP